LFGERLLDVHQAARRLNVCPATIRRRILDQSLPAFRIGDAGNLRVRVTDVDALLRPVEPRER
jgi:excisionase family DNA binding protein